MAGWPFGGRTAALVGLACAALVGTIALFSLRQLGKGAAEADRLRRACEVRDILLTELQHRICNDLASLQATATLLSVSAFGMEARDALSDLSGRIRLFGCIHRRLSPGLAGPDAIDMQAFLTEFCAALREVHLPLRPILLAVEAAPVSLSSGKAILVGSIVNEGVVNALKHAFPSGRPGRIDIRFVGASEGRAELTVTDDGVGLPAKPKGDQGLGTRIMAALASQLDGRFVLESWSVGTRLSLDFPLEDSGT